MISLLMFGAAVACTGEPPAVPGSEVCVGCKPIGGGETTSFARDQQPALGPCYSIYRSSSVDAKRAAELGFAVADAQRRIEREFEVPLRWQAQASDLGAPASGYEPDTRVRVRTKIVEYTAVRPDPARCEGSPCTYQGDACEDWLRLGVRVDVAALDGSLDAAFGGVTIIGPSTVPDFNPEFMVDASVDLTRVGGRLQLFPSLPEPYAGVFRVSFPADGSWGELWTIVAPLQYQDDDDAGIATYQPPIGASVSYQPLRGFWGNNDLRDAAPTVSQAPTSP